MCSLGYSLRPLKPLCRWGLRKKLLFSWDADNEGPRNSSRPDARRGFLSPLYVGVLPLYCLGAGAHVLGVAGMPDLSVEVRDREIGNPDAEELAFLVRAWNAAFVKAKELCWL